MKSWISQLAVAVAGLSWAVLAAAQEPASDRGQPDRNMRTEPGGERAEHYFRMLETPRIANALALTEAQKVQIKAAAAEHQKRVAGERSQLETAGMEQAKLLSEENTDLKALMNAVEKTGKVRTEIAKLQIKHLVEIRSILTPEQRAQLRDLMRKAHERRGESGPQKRQQQMDGRHPDACKSAEDLARDRDTEKTKK